MTDEGPAPSRAARRWLIGFHSSPFARPTGPEPLRGELSGFWSRRIDREHRLVYRIKGDDVEIIACRYHYGDW
jgi:Txe/YoeB family toxin of toxin-antitoxin system